MENDNWLFVIDFFMLGLANDGL